MKIRKAQLIDIDIVMNIYIQAKLFMQKTGNCNQWINGYPYKELILRDILTGNSYVCTNEIDRIIGVFYFSQTDEFVYSQICNGKWLNNNPYGVIHRLAGIEGIGGIAEFCLEWCFNQCGNIRLDTHHDNIIMRKILQQNGYMQCGVITLGDGSKRLAFHKY